MLIEQIARQINADGGHAERSTHYHRYTLDFYLLALGDRPPNEDDPAASSFAAAVRALGTFARAIADDSGACPGSVTTMAVRCSQSAAAIHPTSATRCSSRLSF